MIKYFLILIKTLFKIDINYGFSYTDKVKMLINDNIKKVFVKYPVMEEDWKSILSDPLKYRDKLQGMVKLYHANLQEVKR